MKGSRGGAAGRHAAKAARTVAGLSIAQLFACLLQFTHSVNQNPSRTPPLLQLVLFVCSCLLFFHFRPQPFPTDLRPGRVRLRSARPEMRARRRARGVAPRRTSGAATGGWAFLKVPQQAGGPAEIRPLLPGGRTGAQHRGVGGRKQPQASSPEKRLLWGPSEHS